MKTVFLTLTLTLTASAILSAEPAKPAPADQPATSTAKVVDLRVESQTNPTAVNTPLPRFSWRIETDERGWLQKSYHILVASTPELLAQDKGDLWDSGEVLGRSSILVKFGAPPLPSEQELHWKVQIRDRNGNLSAWSEAASITIKLTGPEPLPSPLFSKDAPQLSSFECSDPLLTSVYKTFASHIHEISSVRDLGLCMRSAAFHRPLLPQAKIWLEHLNNSTNALGFYPTSLPADGTFGSTQSDASISCAHALWWMTAESSSYERNIGTMKRYIFARKNFARAHPGVPFGQLPNDSLPPGDPTPQSFIDDATQGLNLRLLLDMGRSASNDPYELYTLKQYSESLPKPFASSHLTTTGAPRHESITAHLLALRSGLLKTEEQKAASAKGLLRLIGNPSVTKPLKTGPPLAAQNLLPVLTWTGHLEKAIQTVKTQEPAELSPVALAACSEWLISMVAGIDAGEAGFSLIRLHPKIPEESILSYAKAHYDCPYGRISTHWRYDTDGLHFDVTIPPNTLAMVELPATKEQKVTESGNPLASSKMLFAHQRTNQTVSFQMASGSYQFLIEK